MEKKEILEKRKKEILKNLTDKYIISDDNFKFVEETLDNMVSEELEINNLKKRKHENI